jgi:hypothetical protein
MLSGFNLSPIGSLTAGTNGLLYSLPSPYNYYEKMKKVLLLWAQPCKIAIALFLSQKTASKKKHMKRSNKLTLSLVIAIAFVTIASVAQAAYSQNFNTYAGSAATIPTGWSIAFSGTATYNGQGNGGMGTAGAWAYGTTGGTDFAFGALRGATPGNLTLAVGFVNNTGSTITSLTFTWNYEQWRYANTTGFDLSGTGALAGNAIVNAADFVGLAVGTGGNGTPTSTPISLTVSGLSIAPGATYGLSWVTTLPAMGNAGNGIAIDDFNLNLGAVIPEPSTWAMITLGAVLLLGVQCLRRKKS